MHKSTYICILTRKTAVPIHFNTVNKFLIVRVHSLYNLNPKCHFMVSYSCY